MTQFPTAPSGGSGSASWVQHSCSGLEEMEALIRRLAMPLQLLQLDGGHLGGGVVAIRIGPLRLLRLRMDRRIHSWGPKPLGELTISLDLEPSAVRPPMRAHGTTLPETCFFGVDSGREVHLTLPKEVVLSPRHGTEGLRQAAPLPPSIRTPGHPPPAAPGSPGRSG